MKIIRFKYQDKSSYGIIEDQNARLIEGSIFEEKIKLTDTVMDLGQIKALAPVNPSKILCVGLNYKDHAKELDMALPQEPVIFLKPPSSIIGPYDNIIYPRQVARLDYEAELGVVIKRKAKDISTADAPSYILGYTCLNDITARDLQKKDGQWTRSKSFDTFCPIGPYIVTDICPDNLSIELMVNGKRRQLSSTGNLIFNVESLISFISHIMTLLPGDIVATGTPKGVGPLLRGDKVEVKIEKIGSLINVVK